LKTIGDARSCGGVQLLDVKRIERELRARLTERRDLLRRQTPVARQIISQLLDGRIVCTPHKDERFYEFAGQVKFDQLLSGVVFTEGGIRLRGSSWNPIVAFIKTVSALRAIA
jgi:hypothetical protein